MITHGDSDHFRLLDDLLDGVTVNTIVYGGFYKEYSPDFRKWLSSKSKDPLVNPMGSEVASTPNGYFDCGSADVWILASNTPHKKSEWKKNTHSLVLKISHGEFDAILTGDATFETEEAEQLPPTRGGCRRRSPRLPSPARPAGGRAGRPKSKGTSTGIWPRRFSTAGGPALRERRLTAWSSATAPSDARRRATRLGRSIRPPPVGRLS